MKFSSQEEYGLRCLLQIARQGLDGSATIPEISRAEGMTEPYVAKLLNILRRHEFITSTRGQSGGYRLSRPAAQISVAEVLNVLGGKLYEPDFCEKHSGRNEVCAHDGTCSIKPLWDRVQRAVDHVLSAVTLQQVLEGIPTPNVTFGAERERVGAR